MQAAGEETYSSHARVPYSGPEIMCRLWANHARLRGATKYRGNFYRICPVKECPSIVAEVSVHLRNIHGMAAHQVKAEAHRALRITAFTWKVRDLDTFDFVDESDNRGDVPTSSSSAFPHPSYPSESSTSDSDIVPPLQGVR